VVAEAVAVEPVSTPNSLQTGKRTGNFVKSAHLVRFRRLTTEQIQRLSGEFPTQQNRELFQRNRDLLGKNREFETGIVQIDFRRMFSVHTPVTAVQSRLRWRPPQGDIELKAEKHVFSFKPTSRPEHIGDEHVERVQDRKH